MSDFARWMNWDDEGSLNRLLDDVNFASEASFIVGYQGVSITLKRGNTDLSAQTVLLVPASGGRTTTPEPQSASGVGGKDTVYLIGTRGHPTQPDFDVKRGDLFNHGGTVYRVTYVDKTMPGKVECRCESGQ
jgi:hypothetical protein